VELKSWCPSYSSPSSPNYICLNGQSIFNTSSSASGCFIVAIVVDPTNCLPTTQQTFADYLSLLQFLVRQPPGTVVSVLIAGGCRVTGQLLALLPTLKVTGPSGLLIGRSVQLAGVVRLGWPPSSVFDVEICGIFSAGSNAVACADLSADSVDKAACLNNCF
jgi:hypothetical protein